MQYIYPDYYEYFHCIAGRCTHNCCIGWEIDVDPETLAFYDTVPGELGRRLREQIDREGEPHFRLGAQDRCPFLNDENLCEIITALGEEHLCGICARHPRFYHEVDGGVEVGLGLCCEEAARLILGWEAPVDLLGRTGEAEPLVVLRDRAVRILQQRSLPLEQRVAELLSLCGAGEIDWDMSLWAQRLLSLERLDEGWTELLLLLRSSGKTAPVEEFLCYMGEREREYEQLLVYLIYRHLVEAWDELDAACRAAFAVLGYRVIRCLGAILWQKTGRFSFEEQVELARMFSAEIEYSDENVEKLLVMLEEMI